MARKQRVQFSLSPDVVERIDSIPRGERSGEVENALRDHFEDL